MKPQDMQRHPFNNQNIAIVEMQFLLPIPRLGQVEVLQVVVIYQMSAHMAVKCDRPALHMGSFSSQPNDYFRLYLLLSKHLVCKTLYVGLFYALGSDVCLHVDKLK
jgi:hypothetical protein